MSRKSLSVVSAILCGLCLIAASPGAAQQPSHPPELYPHAVGTEWDFRAGAMNLTEQVAGTDDIDGETCYRIVTFVDGKEAATEHLAFRADGIYRMTMAGKKVIPPLCILKLPPLTGTEWKVDSRLDDESIAGRFKITPQSISTALGKRLAIGSAFVGEGTPLQFTYFFVPGVGKVRQEIVINGTRSTVELKAYRPPVPPRGSPTKVP